VNGRNALGWSERFEHDIWYIDNQSLALDIKILCLTLYKIFAREGITAAGEATMSKFTGNGHD
jgi:lipopolysaccharide/colanic/teichoic acid biosynthesis glycosyltransferase